jgi:putative endonuclease
MRLSRQTVGHLGERLAEKHLIDQGARLLHRNYRVDYGEIDLLFEDGDELVAVEVKTRDVEDFVHPEEAIRWSQLRRIVRAMTTYAIDNNYFQRSWRIDVVLIVIERDGSVQRFEHLRSVYPG